LRAMLCEPRVKGHRAAAVSTRKPSLVDGGRRAVTDPLQMAVTDPLQMSVTDPLQMAVTDTLQKDRSGEATVDHGLHVRRARREQPQGANEALRWVAVRMQ
jgi:tRNA A37 threonylcarbamoyladenosine dehydratase